MKHYLGERTPAGCTVEVLDRNDPSGGYPLDPRFDLRRHSPDGFSWGYAGSGPAQLSLALLADALGNDERAQDNYQEFKRRMIAPIEGDTWKMSQEDIRQTVARIEAENRARRR